MRKESILVTGCAGFIGMYVSKSLLERGYHVVGIDNLNDYYDVELKKKRLSMLECGNFKFYHEDIADRGKLDSIFKDENIVKICNLAAQAGVRYSLTNPYAYLKSNIEGFLNLLEIAKGGGIENFVYASSSSVYGGNVKTPFSVEDNVDKPISLYAATKKTDELFAHVYHHLYGLKTTGLRFFTVYGPWGRPDMACYKFALLMMKNKPIEVYNNGNMERDFTYIDDIVSGIIASIEKPFEYEIFNLGNSDKVQLSYFIETIEALFGMKAEKKYLPLQPGDVVSTYADIEKSRRLLGFDPKVKIEEGLKRFRDWFFSYHGSDFGKIEK